MLVVDPRLGLSLGVVVVAILVAVTSEEVGQPEGQRTEPEGPGELVAPGVLERGQTPDEQVQHEHDAEHGQRDARGVLETTAVTTRRAGDGDSTGRDAVRLVGPLLRLVDPREVTRAGVLQLLDPVLVIGDLSLQSGTALVDHLTHLAGAVGGRRRVVLRRSRLHGGADRLSLSLSGLGVVLTHLGVVLLPGLLNRLSGLADLGVGGAVLRDELPHLGGELLELLTLSAELLGAGVEPVVDERRDGVRVVPAKLVGELVELTAVGRHDLSPSRNIRTRHYDTYQG